jgi:uncharacterized membrane protein YoaK (UPF0700 family)
MAVVSPLSATKTVTAMLALTAVTGLVDAVSYLRLGRVFVANMTGNVVFLGLSVYPHSGLQAGASATAIGAFIAGAFCAGWLASRLSHEARQWLLGALGIEATILAVVAILTDTGVLGFVGDVRYWTIAIFAVALGFHNGTARHFGVADLTTTVLTMALTGLSADSVYAGGPGAKPTRRIGSVLAMLVGALVGATLLRWSASAAIGLAALVVALVAASFALAEREVPRELEVGSSK